MTKTVDHLQSRLLAFIGQGIDVPCPDPLFDELAYEVFAFQFTHNPAYRAFCESHQTTPATLTHWSSIPAAPTTAFKDLTLTCFPVTEAVAEFQTSGTTQSRPGRHYFRSLALYDASSARQFNAHLFPDGISLPIRSLIPPSAHSSLAYMCQQVGGRYIEHLDSVSEPVCLLGTAFHFLNLFDSGFRTQLPAGSRVMETGGFKGRSREVAKPELYSLFDQHLGIPATQIVNEYGMTELSSQFYDHTLRQGHQTDLKSIPPWTRVMVIDPQTGQAAPTGQRGLLRIWDLANLWSVACIQTEDWGVLVDDGFMILGRAAGAEPRGCSLNAEALAAQ